MFTKKEIEEFEESLKKGVMVLSKALRDLRVKYDENQKFHKEVRKKIRKGLRQTNGINL
jgi:hypothetical protein